jgi:Rrf2 family protein
MRLSKKLLFAIEAVLDIAYNAGAAPVQSGEINDRQGIPRRYLEPVLQQLVRAGILEGVRGPRGGYRLARDRRRITLGDIAQAVKTTESVTDPFDVPAGSTLGQRVVRPVCQELADGWMRQLSSITIEDLCNRAREGGIDSEVREKADFAI